MTLAEKEIQRRFLAKDKNNWLWLGINENLVMILNNGWDTWLYGGEKKLNNDS